MKTVAIALGVILATAMAGSVAAQVARSSDKSVEKLIEGTQKSVQDFERALDKKLREGTIRGATTEVNVESYLKDYDTDLDRLKERFKPDYAASSELQTVLRKGTDIDTFMDSQPASLKGRSEWDVVEANLKQLAGAYATTFPSKDPAPRRINDGELLAAADAVTKNSQTYKKEIKTAFTKEEKAASEGVQKSVDALANAAKTFKSRVSSDKPASGEAAVLAEKAAAVQTALAGRTLNANAVKAWAGVTAGLAKIDQAFGVSKAAAAETPAPG
jgi:acylphosphatase